MYKKMLCSKPKKMWIDGKCFEVVPYKNLKRSATGALKYSDEVKEPAYKINENGNNKLETAFRIPSIYYQRLETFPNFNIQQLADDTNTEITMPKNGNEGYLNINGSSASDIINAREIIHSTLVVIKEKLRALQFISIPVHTEEVQRNFQLFKESVLKDGLTQGMHETMFQSPLKLHLTLGVFSLMDEYEKVEAIAALKDCKTQIIEPLLTENNLKIKVSGIDCMNTNLKKTHILYAKAEIVKEGNDQILQTLANNISDFFYNRGLIQQYKDNVKLHVTLLNTKYKVSESKSRKRHNWSDRQPFDATNIMEKYKDYYFGESVLDSVHLSNMSSIGEDGYYQPLSIIKF